MNVWMYYQTLGETVFEILKLRTWVYNYWKPKIFIFILILSLSLAVLCKTCDRNANGGNLIFHFFPLFFHFFCCMLAFMFGFSFGCKFLENKSPVFYLTFESIVVCCGVLFGCGEWRYWFDGHEPWTPVSTKDKERVRQEGAPAQVQRGGPCAEKDIPRG